MMMMLVLMEPQSTYFLSWKWRSCSLRSPSNSHLFQLCATIVLHISASQLQKMENSSRPNPAWTIPSNSLWYGLEIGKHIHSLCSCPVLHSVDFFSKTNLSVCLFVFLSIYLSVWMVELALSWRGGRLSLQGGSIQKYLERLFFCSRTSFDPSTVCSGHSHHHHHPVFPDCRY